MENGFLKTVYTFIFAIAFIAVTALPTDVNANWFSSYQLKKQQVQSSVFNSPFNVYHTEGKSWYNSQKQIVMIHGVGGSARDFEPLIANLSDFQLFIVDLPGYSDTSRASGLYSPSNYAKALKEILPTLIDDDAIIIGHSMGGNVSIQLVASAPELAEKLILIDPAGILHKYSYSKFTALHQVKKIPFLNKRQQKGLTSIVDKVNAFVPDSVSDILLSKPSREMLLDNNASVISAISVMEQNIGQQIRNIAVPTLVIWGKSDQVMPYQVGYILEHLIENSQFEVFPNIGHSPQKEAPQKTSRLINYFIEHSNNQKNTTNSNWLDELEIDCQKDNFYQQELNNPVKKLKIVNCSNAELNDVSAKEITVINSAITFKSLNIKNNFAAAMTMYNSDVEVWGADIEGFSGFELYQSRLDLNGANITVKKSPYKVDATSQILASVSIVNELNKSSHWHGFVYRN